MSKKLQYLQLNGLGESIRYILHYAGEEFEDIRHERSQWPIKKVKDSLPYGQMPVYEENHKTINQSLAIARYLAVKAKLIPTDPWEQAEVDAIALTIYDFWRKISQFVQEQDKVRQQALKRQILEEIVDFFFSRFEKKLKENKGYFFGKLTWADFILTGIVEASNLFLGAEIEKNYPTVQALMQRIRELPGVKEYIATRKPYYV